MRLGGKVMTLRELSLLDLKRKQYRAILYLVEGEATFEEAKRARGKTWWPRAFREGPRGQTKKRLSAGRRARPMAPHRPADLASLWAKWRGTGSRG